MSLKFIALDSEPVERLRNGEPDAYGRQPEISKSDGDGNPCRHCLDEIPRDQPMLILAHRPFDSLQPYAETGPIFLCAHACDRYPQTTDIPALYRQREMLIRGYDQNQRIVYGSGKVIDMESIRAEAERLFEDSRLAFIHVRSSTNNCYHFRIERD